jgi:predicted nucleic acid-binding protein
LTYLIDTNIVSATAPHRDRPAALVEWLEQHSDALFLSVITIAEIDAGVAKLRRQGARSKADRLARWLDALLHLYSQRVLDVDIPVARKLGVLIDRARKTGHQTSLADLALAATAMQHGLIVLTRNLKHFEPLGLRAHDPFVSLPA